MTLQVEVSVLVPTQFAPLPTGAGFVHVRSLVLCPLPQVAPHPDHMDQSDHCPFTINSQNTL